MENENIYTEENLHEIPYALLAQALVKQKKLSEGSIAITAKHGIVVGLRVTENFNLSKPEASTELIETRYYPTSWLSKEA